MVFELRREGKNTEKGFELNKIFLLIAISISILSIGFWLASYFYLSSVKEFYVFDRNIIGDFSNFFEKVISSDINELDKLSKIGDFFNVTTAFSSSITVCLVAYGVYLQKKELSEIKKITQNEEKTNRTLSIIDDWIKNNTSTMDKIRKIDALLSLGNRFENKIDFLALKYYIMATIGNEIKINEKLNELNETNRKSNSGTEDTYSHDYAKSIMGDTKEGLQLAFNRHLSKNMCWMGGFVSFAVFYSLFYVLVLVWIWQLLSSSQM